MIVGHNRQIEYLNKVLKRGRLAHAYLFYGPEQIGKFTTAKVLAKAFWCKEVKRNMENICNECSDCCLIEEDTHPHVLVLDLDHTLISKKEIRKDIPIEDIRELKRRFSYAPQPGQWRIAIINNAEKMSHEAANAFLKLLEEPGGQTLLILVTSSREMLLPTIVSRTQPIRFSLVNDDAIGAFIKNKARSDKEREEIVSYAFGRPGLALSLVEDADGLKRERTLSTSIGSILKRSEIPELLRLSARLAMERGLREKGVNYLLRNLRGSLLSEPTSRDTIRNIKAVNRITTLLDISNVNPRLALDIAFLEATARVFREVN